MRSEWEGKNVNSFESKKKKEEAYFGPHTRSDVCVAPWCRVETPCLEFFPVFFKSLYIQSK